MLKEQIVQELKEAMKARDALKTSTLRMLKAEIMNYEVSGAAKTADDETVISLIKKGIKQRRDAADGFRRGGNDVSAQKELDEIKILEKYMPEQLSEEGVKKIVREIIARMNAGSSDFGKVMGAAMGELKGRSDGSAVSKAVKELLK